MQAKRFFFICAIVLATALFSLGQKMSQHDINVPSEKMSQQDHAIMQLHTGKTGNLTIPEPTIIGNVTLQPGEYEVKHVNDRTGHYVEFARMTKAEARSPYYYNLTYNREIVARLNCSLEPLHAKVKQTALLASAEKGQPTGLEIRGENVKHVF
jgi:hypothetical protein